MEKIKSYFILGIVLYLFEGYIVIFSKVFNIITARVIKLIKEFSVYYLCRGLAKKYRLQNLVVVNCPVHLFRNAFKIHAYKAET